MIVASTLWTEGFLDDLISFTRDLLWYLTGRQAIYSSLITANTLFYLFILNTGVVQKKVINCQKSFPMFVCKYLPNCLYW